MYAFTAAQMTLAAAYVTAERTFGEKSQQRIDAQKALKAALRFVAWDDEDDNSPTIAALRQARREAGPEDKRTAAAKAPAAPVCTRCDGSGHFSFNPRYGTTCFRCQGSGVAA